MAGWDAATRTPDAGSATGRAHLSPRLGRVVIVGVGLIGGSVGLGLRGRYLASEVVGLDSDPAVLTTALALGVIDSARLEPGEWLRDADLIVLAAPVRALPGLGERIAPFLGPDTVLTDVGSVKQPLLDAIGAWPPELRARFVGGHPMAGSERAGVQNANAGLLENAIWVITPTAETADWALRRVTQVVRELGARPVELNAHAHDRLVAMISHLPYLLAVALTRMVARHEERDDLAVLAAGGFRDLTRVASGDPLMSRDMVIENRSAVREALARYRRALDELDAALEDPKALLEAALDAKRSRDSLPVVKRSLLPPLHDLVVAIPDRPGELARLTTLLGEAGVNIKDLEVLAIRDAGGAIRVGFSAPEELIAAEAALSGAGYPVRQRGD